MLTFSNLFWVSPSGPYTRPMKLNPGCSLIYRVRKANIREQNMCVRKGGHVTEGQTSSNSSPEKVGSTLTGSQCKEHKSTKPFKGKHKRLKLNKVTGKLCTYRNRNCSFPYYRLIIKWWLVIRIQLQYFSC